jgi:hypothetical protein
MSKRKPACGSTADRHVAKYCDECKRIYRQNKKRRDLDELTTEEMERACPACRIRHRIPPLDVDPNYMVLNIERRVWFQLRAAAEAFDRAASNVDGEDAKSGAGDGETLFPARTFVDWIKNDCEGFKVGHVPDFDGIRGGTADPIPYHRRGVA